MAAPVSNSPIPLTLPQTLPSPETPWKVNPQLLKRIDISTANSFSLKTVQVIPSDPEFTFLQQYFMHSKPPGYGIKNIVCIHNPSHIAGFENGLIKLEQESQNSVFIPRGQEEDPKPERLVALDRWRRQVDLFSPIHVGNPGDATKLTRVKILPVWHGTNKSVCQSISDSGFTFFGKHHYFFKETPKTGPKSTDFGYFGSGIYFTNSAEYATKYAPGHLILAFIGMREPLPVVSDVAHPAKCTDMKKLEGRGAYQNYNAHFIPVASIKPDDPNCLNYFPCYQNQTPAWDEFVVFQNNHALARYWVELAADGPAPIISDIEASYTKACQISNKPEAYLAFKSLAEQGHAPSQVVLGNLLAKGEGVPSNERAAVRWYREAARQNNGEGKFKLALCYHAGKGAPQDSLLAMSLLQQATSLGYTPAKSFMEKEFYTDIWMASELGGIDYIKEKVSSLSSKNPFSSALEKGINALNGEGKAPLPLASFHKQTEVAFFLLSNKASPVLPDKDGYQPLHWAAKGGSLLIADELVRQGASINAPGAFGRTPLHMAVFNSQEHMVDFLVKKGANINAQTGREDNLKTPLHDAVIHLDQRMVRLLLGHKNIDVNIVDIEGHTPFYHAVYEGHLDIMKMIQQHPSFQYPQNPSNPNSIQELIKLKPRQRAEEVIAYLKLFIYKD